MTGNDDDVVGSREVALVRVDAQLAIEQALQLHLPDASKLQRPWMIGEEMRSIEQWEDAWRAYSDVISMYGVISKVPEYNSLRENIYTILSSPIGIAEFSTDRALQEYTPEAWDEILIRLSLAENLETNPAMGIRIYQNLLPLINEATDQCLAIMKRPSSTFSSKK